MKVAIDAQVFEKHPEFQAGIIVVSDLDNTVRLEEARHLVRDIAHLRSQVFFRGEEKIHPLLHPWVVAQKEFGARAVHYHTSVEQLLQKVTRGKAVISADTVNNLFSYVSLEYIVPGGCVDMSNLVGDVVYKIAQGTEKVDPVRVVKKGALFLTDDKKIISTKLSYWQHKKVRVGVKSQKVLIHFEFLGPVTNGKQIVEEMKELVAAFTQAKVKGFVLSKKKPSRVV